METASCMLLLSTCGVFRTQTWSWGRHSSALSRRQTHATLNSAGSWSLWNLRSLWKRGFATTPGYVLFPTQHPLPELPGGGKSTLGQPLLSEAYDLLGHMSLAKQNIIHGNLLWVNWGFCHPWETPGQQIPSCVSFHFSLIILIAGLPGGMAFPVAWWLFFSLIVLCMLYYLEVASQTQTSPFSVTSLEFLCTFGWGASVLCLIRDFLKAGAVPVILPHFWVCLVMENSKGRKPKWGGKGWSFECWFPERGKASRVI